MNRHTTILLLAAMTGAGALGGLSGCRGERSDEPPRQFFPDMDDGPKWKPQSESEFFVDSRTMRPRVEGTVAFGESTNPAHADRARYLKADTAFYTGVDEALLGAQQHTGRAGMAGEAAQPEQGGSAAQPHDHAAHAPAVDPNADIYVARMPVAPTAQSIKNGQERFNIYCSACHGYKGDGKGLAGQRWSYPVPSFHDPKYADRSQKLGKDGYLFHVALNGVPDADPTKPPKMPPYKHALSEQDAWDVVAYLRVLQAQWEKDMDRVPADLMQQLRNQQRPAPAPAAEAEPAAGGSGTTAPASGESPTEGGAR